MKDMEEPPRGTVVVARRKINGDWLGAKNTDVGWRITVGGYAAIRWADLLSLTDIVAVYLPDVRSGTDADSLRVGAIPRGGRPGQFLVKMSDDDYDVAWAAPPYVPAPVLGPFKVTNTVAQSSLNALQAQEADEAETVAEQQDRAERLRRAASHLDNLYLRTTTGHLKPSGKDVSDQVAALLRAVADMHCLQPGEPDDGPCRCPEHLAALALADEILGEEEA